MARPLSPTLFRLEKGEPLGYELLNPGGRSPAVLVCDHASARLPRRVGDLGLGLAARMSHIGWDIGIARMAAHLSALLDAPLVMSSYSRLVIDCNRPLASPASIPRQSGGIDIPGNDISREDAVARAVTCFWPYHHAITRVLDARRAARQPTVLLSLHSFTPELLGQKRPWHVALLSGRDRRLAELFLEWLQRQGDLVVGDNQPYQVTDEGDYTIPVHGERRGLPCVLIEVRQDGLGTEEGARGWARRLGAACEEIIHHPGLVSPTVACR